MMWAEFGLAANPYATDPIPPSEEGDQLLAGRDAELEELLARVRAAGAHPTVEGDDGVGKTSLVSVVCHRLRSEVEQGASSPVFLPLLGEPVQPRAGHSVDLFVERVYLRVATTILGERETLRRRGLRVPDAAEVRDWLRSPIVRGWGAGVNTSPGDTVAGLLGTVDRWLHELFPGPRSGGFVCVADNLAALETAHGARTLLEAIGGPLLDRCGLRWVLCGARGGLRASARLPARLGAPLELGPLADEDVEAAVERRLRRYRTSDDATAPIGPSSFRTLYEVLGRDLREAFTYAEAFSIWLYSREKTAGTPGELDALFEAWLAGRADLHRRETELGNRAWQVFDQLAARRGRCSTGDFEDFGFHTRDAMRTHLAALETQNLVTTLDNHENDKRRRTIVLTPRGWLVRYARGDHRPPRLV
ncbi:MarR family winged helix-turn-helix transcriptional regulator [Actinophytocola xanthii]|uniref:MarR family winged helix-turn-helix transcriptional regulator n=1 Tax=Actinophytocola xanthii TaxID=1912961 RepID=UPI001178AEC1|nr:MarR family winged helix-turn-helix transcriptional regulator [Actinophytocola xanthii]